MNREQTRKKNYDLVLHWLLAMAVERMIFGRKTEIYAQAARDCNLTSAQIKNGLLEEVLLKEGFQIHLMEEQGGNLEYYRDEKRAAAGDKSFFRIYHPKTKKFTIRPTNEEKDSLVEALDAAVEDDANFEQLNPADRETFTKMEAILKGNGYC